MGLKNCFIKKEDVGLKCLQYLYPRHGPDSNTHQIFVKEKQHNDFRDILLY